MAKLFASIDAGEESTHGDINFVAETAATEPRKRSDGRNSPPQRPLSSVPGSGPIRGGNISARLDRRRGGWHDGRLKPHK